MKLSLTAHHGVISSRETASLGQVTTLTQLSLESHSLEPVALQQLTQLEDLSISASRITGPHGPGAALVTLLQQLPHLTQLQLRSDHDIPAGDSAAQRAPLAFAAIPTSSKLQHLKLHLPLPSSTCSKCFCSAAQLPALQTFDASASEAHPLAACATTPSSARGLQEPIGSTHFTARAQAGLL